MRFAIRYVAAAIALVTTLTAESRGQTIGGEWTAFTSMIDVNDILVTNQGIWAATQGGALFYDRQSRQYSRFTLLDGLAGNRVLSVTVDHNDHIWLGTEGLGLSRYRPDTGTFDVIGQIGLEREGDALDEILQLEEVDRAWQTADLVQHRRGADIWRHLCIVPLKNPEQVNGLLIVADKEKRDRPIGPFDASDETLLQAFGNQAGSALHNARLHRELEEAYAQLKEARDVSYRASDIVRQLMIFSRREPRAENKEVEIGLLLRDAIEICRKSFPSRIPIRVEIQPDLPPLQCDPGQLEQVVLNLCINARDALADAKNDADTVQLTADTCDGRPATETDSESRQRPCIRIRVSDNGPGMDDETRRRIFEPFFTTKDEDKGTGLGLSTVHTIVEQHAGWIDCKSRPGEGATFSVYLPLDEVQS